MDNDVFVKALAAALAPHLEREKHDLPAGYTLTTNWMHGQNGIFGAPGLERDIFSTRVQPTGMLSMLPAVGSNVTHPLVGFFTGVTQGDTTNQDGPCDEPPTAGNLKSCKVGSAFGRLMLATDPIQVDRIGEIVNRGEMTDLRVVNDPVMRADLAIPGMTAGGVSAAIRQEVLARFYALGAMFQERLAPMVWAGNTANNSAGGGYREFNGFDLLITTGHTDVETGVACPSLDSVLVNANYASVNTNAASVFYWMLNIWRDLKHRASTMGMNPVRWVLAMRANLFRELTDYWPCVYASHRCDATNNQLSNNTDAMLMRQMSDQMYNGMYLILDGERVPVVIDDSIPEDTNVNNGNVPAGCFASDIYFIPITVTGGYQVTFMEYFNFNGPNGVSQAIELGFLANEILVSDGGRFLWTKSRDYTCVQWQSLTKLRLRLLTPFLAARLQNVLYCPFLHFRDPFAAQPYFVNGGNQTISDNSIYGRAAE